jgi:dihydroorotate dehydrogenase
VPSDRFYSRFSHSLGATGLRLVGKLNAPVYRLTGGRVPLIGIGGIDSAETAVAKIEAGATLIQLYTGLVYEGPGLIDRIKDGLVAAIERANLSSISDLVGTKAEDWARRPLDY